MNQNLWPFTEAVIEQLEKMGVKPPRIDEHDIGDDEGGDFIFGEVTPHLSLSEGEYLKIDQDQGLYSYSFGTRGCCGGDPTYGGEIYFEPSEKKAADVAKAFVDYFHNDIE
ncbi:hypothetical protein [Shewanella xiamenensis]|uniref:hypothetical protein n=1 Tax=Shewanella xiamenensis TaxID=332186 RepID=UPI0008499E12|nr:hypothetical protein [Shewanella xiamenensis]ODR83792.1 hypothetical protein ABT47_23840 [Shewanella xiamenensis]